MHVIASRAHPWLALLRERSPANHEPLPEPGFVASGAELYYATERGRLFKVRDAAGRACLVPVTALPLDGVSDPEAEEDRVLGILAEAADRLDEESLASGWYAWQGYLFFHDHDASVLVVPAEGEARFKPFPVVTVPAGATQLDVVPVAAQQVVDATQQSEPVGGTHA